MNTTPVVTPNNGSVVINTDGTYTYTPDAGFIGTDQFIYEICDNGTPVMCSNGTAIITVLPLTNSAPVAINDIVNVIVGDTVLGNVLTNDFDFEGDSLFVATTPLVDATNGTLTLNPDGTFTYIPDAGFEGVDSFTYVVCDNGNPVLCDTATVAIQVFDNANGTNDPPIANNDAFQIVEGNTLSVSVISNDADPDGNNLTINQVPLTAPENGTVTINNSGVINYIPDAGFVGVDSFTYVICDDGTPSMCDTAQVVIDVLPVAGSENHPPVAGTDAAIVNEGDPANGNLLDNDADPDGDNITINTVPVTNPANGTVTIAANGEYTYTPDQGFTGTDQFVYEICDDGNPVLCSQGTAIITVLPITNTAPIAINDIAIVGVGDSTTGNVLTNDIDLDGDNLTVNTTPVTPPSNGTLVLNDDGSYTYTPNPGFTGVDSFSYVVCDDGSPQLCDTATVAINVIDNVSPDNNAPTANNDAFTVTSGNILSGVSIVSNDFDIDGNLITVNVTPVTNPANGTVTISPNGEIIYTPNANFIGTDSFTYVICDDGIPVLCDTATAFVTVLKPADNNPPLAGTDANTVFEGDTATGNLLANDADPDGDNITINTVPVTNPANGTVTILPNGDYEYIPVVGFTGTDEFIYEICDDGNPVLCTQGTAIILVLPEVNIAPVAINDVTTVVEEGTVTGNVLTNDFDPNGDNLTVNTTPIYDVSNGTLILLDNGTFSYTPNAGFTGVDSFSYVICDDGNPVLCDTATVAINVIGLNPDNNPPTANNDAFTITAGNTLGGVSIVTNDFDIDGDNITINTTPITNPANGTVTISPNGEIIYTPNANFIGTDSFTYVICDDGNPVLCDTATAFVTVLKPADNNPPLAGTDVNTVFQADTATGNLLLNDVDPDGDNITINTVPVTNPANGTVTILPNGDYEYIPNPSFTGTDQFIYEICDDGNPVLCTQGTAVILVLPEINLPPVAINDITTVIEEGTVAGNVLTNDFDPNLGDSLIVNTTPIYNVSNGTLVLEDDGTFSYQANPGFTGVDSFSYVVCDNGNPALCDTATVAINVIGLSPDNNPPTANNDAFTITAGNTLGGVSIVTNDFDIDGDNITINTTPITNPANGTVTISPNGEIIYTPNANFIGTDSFTYVICDDGNPVLCDTATTYITVLKPADNNPPFAGTDANWIYEGDTATGNLLLNDTDPDGDNITINTTPIAGPANGTVTILPNGDYVYVPGPLFTGTDQFIYEICDDGNPVLCTQGTAIIIVLPVNNAPIANNDTMSVVINTVLNGAVTGNDVEPDGDNVTVTLLDTTSNGGIILNSDGTFIYTPNANFIGTDSLTYILCDDAMPVLCDTATVYINITIPPCNILADTLLTTNTTDCNAPIELCLPVPLQTIGNYQILIDGVDYSGFTFGCDFDTAVVYFLGAVFNNGVGPYRVNWTIDGQAFVDTVANFQGAVATMNSWDPTGNWVFSSAGPTISGGDYTKNYGNISFLHLGTGSPSLVGFNNVLTALGSKIELDPTAGELVLIDTVNGCADTLTLLTYCVPVDTVGVSVMASDSITVCVDTIELPGTIVSVTNSCPTASGNNATVTIVNGSVCVDIVGLVQGVDTACIVVCDDQGLCDTTIVIVTVTPDTTILPNNPPIAINDDTITTLGVPVIIPVLINDTDPDGDLLTVTGTPVVSPSNGSVVLNPNGTFTYTPNAGFIGIDQFFYEVCDNGIPSLCDTAMVTIGLTGPPCDLLGDTLVYQTTDCDAPIEVCLPVELTEINNYSIYIDGAPYTGLTFGCDYDTTIVYFVGGVQAIGSGPYEIQWLLNAQTMSAQVANMSEAVARMNSWDPNANWSLDGPVIRGGDFNNSYGGITFTNLATSQQAQVGFNNQLIAYGSVILLPSSANELVMVDTVNNCVDTSTIIVVCSTNDTLGLTVHVDQTDTACVNLNELPGTVVSITNACPVDGVTFTYSADSCVYITGTNIGTDQACIVVCDEYGVCDTTIINITILPPTDTVYITIPTSDSAVLCLSPSLLPGNVDTLINLNCTTPTLGSVGTIASGDTCVTYTAGTTPGAADTVCLVLVDNEGNPDTTIYIINVVIGNLPPVAINDINNTMVDFPVSGSVMTNDFDLDGNNISVDTASVTTPVNGGTVTIDTAGNYTYIPAAGFSGIDSFSYVICDDGTPSYCDTATVVITIIDITGQGNNPPTANDDATVTLVNTQVIGAVLNNDFDQDGDNIIIGQTPITPTSNGTVVLSSNGTYIYTPDPGFVGQDTFTYRICDDGIPSLCDTAMVVITVLPTYDGIMNYPPFAGDDANITDMNIPVSGVLIANDGDLDGNNIAVNTTPISDPSNGTVVISPNGLYTYTPNPGFCGTDQFVYEICDDGTPSLCAQATVYLTVRCINENTAIDTIYVTATINTSVDSCVDLSELPGDVVSIVDLGCATTIYDQSYSVADSCLTYNAGPMAGGLDTVCVVVTDEFGNTDTTIFLINVVELADTISIDTIPVFLFVNTIDTFCTDLSQLTGAPVGITNLGCAPTQFAQNVSVANGCLIYTSGATAGGIDTVCVVVEDNSGNLDTTVFLVTVIPNDIDTVIADTFINSTIVVCADTTDLPGNIISAVDLGCAETPDNGTVTISANGCITYVAGSVAGSDTICLAICDDLGFCDTSFIVINVNPTIDTIYTMVGAGTDVVTCVDTTQLPGTILSITPCEQPDSGTITVITGQDSACVLYTPNPGFIGSDTACVVICDDQGYCDTTILIYTVQPSCDTVDFFPSFVTLDAENCIQGAEFCIPTNPNELFGWDIYVDGVLQPSPPTSCNNDTLITYNLMNVPTNAQNLDNWASSNGNFGPITFTNFQEVVDSMNVWTSAGNWTLNGSIISGGANDPLGYGDLVFSTFMGNQIIVGRMLEVTPNGTSVSLTSGVHQIIISNPLTLCSDTTVVTVNCTQTDTIPVLLPVNTGITLCPDDSQLAGPIVTMTNICAGSVDNGTVIFSPTGSTCFEYQADNVAGLDTICLVACDAAGNCDTTIYLVTVVPAPDTQIVVLDLPATDTVCLDTTQLPGNITSIIIGCDEPDIVNIDIFAPNTCIFLTAAQIGDSTTCIIYCDDQGFCDTTYLIISVTSTLELPVAVDDSIEICDVSAIEVLANDSIGGGIDTMYVLDEPYGGTYFVNFNNTISYTRVNVAPFTDSLTYVICNSEGCDTATVIIDIDCTEDVVVYTGFSPNNDNVNDFFTIDGLDDYPSNRVMIFNRWGNQVYQTDGYLNDWGGTWEGKDLPDGTYFYILEYEVPATGETKKLSGYVQIHR